ncbi:MAG: hypothetical protein IJ801_05835 [Lachnospiraceae bacterium]|nr:hypothetical protein [Lachnospiraceae bacterium]
MRITTAMLAQTSKKTGIPVAQGSLLNVLEHQNNQDHLLDALNRNQQAKRVSALQKEFQELEKETGDLTGRADRLLETDEDGLFGEAQDTKETKNILPTVKGMLESYNKTLALLKKTDNSLNRFYSGELEKAAEKSAESLKTVGVTRSKDGSLKINEDILAHADYDTLKTVFGDQSDLTKKLNYIGGRISEHAQTNLASAATRYNAGGTVCQNVSYPNSYNFFG